MKKDDIINEPYELEDNFEVIEEAESESDKLFGAEESFEESKERPNEKEDE
ncbi:hypothetical protein [Lacicoccus qingdaonensis]|uniref:Uncharacterized protein n=1 Tax=Lacicoccus qingdaonensis TaxID=576118 RepID=A0A1G9F3H0_9BACL|nr:hypothetical protein [Salinicoccus qingdaonensis]SDK82952.1 hypothetical protein SAMN05216216_110103 [Salinicoccus qingdaonensis]